MSYIIFNDIYMIFVIFQFKQFIENEKSQHAARSLFIDDQLW